MLDCVGTPPILTIAPAAIPRLLSRHDVLPIAKTVSRAAVLSQARRGLCFASVQSSSNRVRRWKLREPREFVRWKVAEALARLHWLSFHGALAEEVRVAHSSCILARCAMRRLAHASVGRAAAAVVAASTTPIGPAAIWRCGSLRLRHSSTLSSKSLLEHDEASPCANPSRGFESTRPR